MICGIRPSTQPAGPRTRPADTSPLMLAAGHKATETAVRASGLGFTFRRNGWYTENRTAALGGAIAAGGA